MKARVLSILVLTVSFFYSCQKEEDVKPATNPRFSVAEIQETNTQGISVAANVFDYGSDEIIEYGFAVSAFPEPKIQPLSVTKMLGKPELFFQMVITTILKKDVNYWVAAYIKTNKNIVYSQPVSFVSTGSGGFFVEKINFNNEVYFGDTVEVIGNNFSSGISAKNVKIAVYEAEIISGSETHLKFIIPSELVALINTKTTELSIFISDTEIQREFKRVFVFKDPIFDVKNIRNVNFRDLYQITGKYFFSSDLIVKLSGIPVSPTTIEDNIIEIPVYSLSSAIQNPNVTVEIRGKEFALGQLFLLNPTQLDPNQSVVIDFGQPVIFRGNNFGPDLEGFNKLFDEFGNEYPFQTVSIEENSMEIIFDHNKIYPDRIGKLFVQNFGINTTNSMDFKIQSPFLLKGYINNEFNPNSLDGVTIDNKGYFMANNKICFIDFNNDFQFQEITTLPSDYNFYSFLKSFHGKIYFGSGEDEMGNDVRSFYSFDPFSNQVVKLADLPEYLGNPISIFPLNKNIIFEGNYYRISLEDQGNTQARYSYSIENNTWEKIDDKSFPGFFGRNPRDYVFQKGGEIFAIQPRDYLTDKILKRLDKTTLEWIPEGQISLKGTLTYKEPIVFNDMLYLVMDQTFHRLNLTSYDFERLLPLYSNPLIYSVNGFTFPNGNVAFYIWDGRIVEFNPSLLD
ncbi:hypothetical protein MMU07_17925 [Aquiflexum sp. LQ15W]|uniref:hypothetical protein n=1 Tax=Cognataquiflexum nitidum TaxID=2922272 RepID=UPI001F13EFED|nr:hypothetical protein [Cognataquiflexum nitidum]MCH6201465.1 hypothetical protein [Cognataquiflexum nitidum]